MEDPCSVVCACNHHRVNSNIKSLIVGYLVPVSTCRDGRLNENIPQARRAGTEPLPENRLGIIMEY